MTSTTGAFLFSIDLEDPREHVPGGFEFPDRVPANTEAILQWLRDRGWEATFFVVGRIAERHPELIRRIVSDGHEIACHTHTHLQLDKHSPESLREDLTLCLETLSACGADGIRGFRAPTFSLTRETTWVYPLLRELGFRYSSSVFPAKSVLYGWPEFGAGFREIDGIYEMPMTIRSAPPRVPVTGGVYFRLLPFTLIRRAMAGEMRTNGVVQSYFHPYDIDAAQDRYMHADLDGNRWLNHLMYFGRSRVLPRLERLLKHYDVTSYRTFLRERGA